METARQISVKFGGKNGRIARVNTVPYRTVYFRLQKGKQSTEHDSPSHSGARLLSAALLPPPTVQADDEADLHDAGHAHSHQTIRSGTWGRPRLHISIQVDFLHFRINITGLEDCLCTEQSSTSTSGRSAWTTARTWDLTNSRKRS
jgi:hypothetical protein